MTTSENRITALGIPAGDFFPHGATVPLGDFGAIVVGRNGVGKTRFVRGIGSTIDLIYDRGDLGLSVGGLVTPDESDQPWHAATDDNGLQLHPHSLYELVVGDLAEIRAGNRPPERVSRFRAQAEAAVRQIDDDEVSLVGLIFVSLGCRFNVRESPEYVYLLAACCEIARHASLGVVDNGMFNGAAVRPWFNTNRLITPVLCDVLQALSAFEGMEVEISDSGFKYLDEPKLPRNGDLEGLAKTPLAMINLAPTPGILGHYTPRFPLDACGAGSPVFDGDSGPSPFEDLPVNRRGHAERSFNWYPDAERSFSWAAKERRLTWTNHEGDDMQGQPSQNSGPFDVRTSQYENSLPLRRVAFGADQHTYSFPGETWEQGAAVALVANEVFRVLMPDAPQIFLADHNGTLGWFARHGDSVAFPLKDLSEARYRWASLSIRMADRYLDRLLPLVGVVEYFDAIASLVTPQACGVSAGLPGHVLVLDEPERGLHRAAEAPLAKGLVKLAQLVGFKPVVVTHSPTFIREFLAANATTIWIHRNETNEPVIEHFVTTELSALAEASGLAEVDVVQLVRTFLFVEGEHDRAVIATLFAEEFANLGVAIIPLRGAKGASQVIDSAVLWRFTGARIFVLLDHLDDELVLPLWQQAVDKATSGDRTGALSVLAKIDNLPRTGQTEAKAVRELLTHAVEEGSLDRIQIIGLSERDIINYFHPSEILEIDNSAESAESGAVTWKRLEKEWRRDGVAIDFKSWLVKRFPGSQLNAEQLAVAVRRWDAIPDDLARVLQRLQDE